MSRPDPDEQGLEAWHDARDMLRKLQPPPGWSPELSSPEHGEFVYVLPDGTTRTVCDE